LIGVSALLKSSKPYASSSLKQTIQQLRMTLRISSRLSVFASSVVLFAGCSSQGVSRVGKPSVDPVAATGAVMEALDGNGDGSLDATELAKCPPLAQSIASYDTSKDGKIAAEELTARWSQLVGSTSAFTTATCSVVQAGRPLAGAMVKLRPIVGLAESLSLAEGTTDDRGVAQPGVPADQLPANLANTPLIFPGLYHVEITHPQEQIPARYNTATELSWEIDPNARTATVPRFDLKAN
jgi:hypothetical protein